MYMVKSSSAQQIYVSLVVHWDRNVNFTYPDISGWFRCFNRFL